jgi:hypothetical protein
MPMMAISGRWRFGGFKAAIVASRSSCAIAGGAATEGVIGSEKIQPAPITANSAAAASTPHNRSRKFIVRRLSLHASSIGFSYNAAVIAVK